MARKWTILCCFVLLGVAAGIASAQSQSPDKKKKVLGDPYPLSVCVVSGEKLGSMGSPFLFDHEGREIRFCCKSCVGKFKKDSKKFIAKIDEQIVKQQAPHYPVTTCFVSDEPLVEDGSKPVDLVYKNRLVQFCCRMCVKDFKKDPAKVLKKLDEAVIAKQVEGYPLTTCVVSGQKLGSMGEPIDFVVANRLLRFCCKGCIRKVKSDPLKYLADLDAAMKKAKGESGK